ncbi:GNAT family N-acetyltransferase [Planosporangium thailandense]|uniref:GNAT family N-acetyltransferase n=1 Tax=Planosporangium thailandense TaxID=765197 RepID=A0ABX0YA50_9ACTN|nr:GNAT family N-acetyltransferase [Planosporangium thailandense]NJC74094.1 GNAT family N-acetyltransferase [Planosporangium thailandense]
MTQPTPTTVDVADYTPGSDLDTELATLGYATTTGWPDQRPITDTLVRSRLRPVGRAPATLLATHRDPGGRLLAAAALRWPGYPHTPGRLWGPIVHPTHQRRGLGHAVLTALAQRLADSDATILTAEIPVSRAAARHFYQSAGWQPAGEATLLKRRLPLPAAEAVPPGTRLRTLNPVEDLTAPLAQMYAPTTPDRDAAADTYRRWRADERFTPDGLTLAEDHHGLIAAALTYPLAHSDPREPAEVLLTDLLTTDAGSDRLRAALVTAALNTVAPTVNATVARAVTAAPDTVNLLVGLGFHHVDRVRYYRYTPRTTAGPATRLERSATPG